MLCTFNHRVPQFHRSKDMKCSTHIDNMLPEEASDLEATTPVTVPATATTPVTVPASDMIPFSYDPGNSGWDNVSPFQNQQHPLHHHPLQPCPLFMQSIKEYKKKVQNKIEAAKLKHTTTTPPRPRSLGKIIYHYSNLNYVRQKILQNQNNTASSSSPTPLTLLLQPTNNDILVYGTINNQTNEITYDRIYISPCVKYRGVLEVIAQEFSIDLRLKTFNSPIDLVSNIQYEMLCYEEMKVTQHRY